MTGKVRVYASYFEKAIYHAPITDRRTLRDKENTLVDRESSTNIIGELQLKLFG
jgi:hypothetical protein